MKNIAHFASGLVLASFVPGVLERASTGSLLIALGGACAMLPDVLDFRLLRYLLRIDASITPDPSKPDAQAIADQIAEQISLVVQDGRTRVVQINAARRTAGEWVSYTVAFDISLGDVIVTLDGNEAEPARAPAGILDDSFNELLRAEELGGCAIRVRARDQCAQMEFLPWHRQWTHSFLVAVALGLLLGWLIEPLAGLTGMLGYAVHILGDEGGHMGSNLFAPLTHRRTRGLRLYHSADAIPNLLVVWASLSLLLLNLDQAGQTPVINTGPYLVFVVSLPVLLLVGISVRRAWKYHAQAESPTESEATAEVDATAE